LRWAHEIVTYLQPSLQATAVVLHLSL